MMNIQNPASYPPQQAYTAHGNPMAQAGMQPTSYPNDFSQNQFQQTFPQTPQRQNQFTQQIGSQIHPNAYQQYQQQQQQHHQQQQQQVHQQQQQAFMRPQSQGNNTLMSGPQQRQSPSNIPSTNQNQHQASRTSAPHLTANTPQMSSNMAMTAQMQQGMANATLTQQVQMQNAAQQMGRPVPPQQQPQGTNQTTAQIATIPLSPQSASREKARVSVLLDINSHLLQEVISLQAQGKAGPVTQQSNNPNQQSPTSPSSAATENNTFSPTDSVPQIKATGPPSKEYQECMRRLQANLSYLAAIADAKKRPDGKVPPYPAIISPPPHLKAVHELYRKLALLFPEASQSKTNQAIAFASAQHQQSGQAGQHTNNMGQSGMNSGVNMSAGMAGVSGFDLQSQ